MDKQIYQDFLLKVSQILMSSEEKDINIVFATMIAALFQVISESKNLANVDYNLLAKFCCLQLANEWPLDQNFALQLTKFTFPDRSGPLN